MGGTRQGGLKAVQTNKLRHGDNFYSILGQKGGAAPNKTPKGFAADRNRASWAGRKGGLTKGINYKTHQLNVRKSFLRRLIDMCYTYAITKGAIRKG